MININDVFTNPQTGHVYVQPEMLQPCQHIVEYSIRRYNEKQGIYSCSVCDRDYTQAIELTRLQRTIKEHFPNEHAAAKASLERNYTIIETDNKLFWLLAVVWAAIVFHYKGII